MILYPFFFFFFFFQVTGQWKGVTAGGCGNHPTYAENPRYQLVIENGHTDNYILLILKGPKQYQIGFDINAIVLNDANAETAFKTKSSGPYRFLFLLFFLRPNYFISKSCVVQRAS